MRWFNRHRDKFEWAFHIAWIAALYIALGIGLEQCHRSDPELSWQVPL